MDDFCAALRVLHNLAHPGAAGRQHCPLAGENSVSSASQSSVALSAPNKQAMKMVSGDTALLKHLGDF